MSEHPTCSVVIRAFNEEDHIARLLAGIMEQTLKDVEIILVDSGSTDATLAIASRYPVRIVNIQPDEFTFGRSLNLGCEATSSDIIVIASAHVYPVYPDWLEQMVAAFRDSELALVYGRQVGNDTTRFSEHQIFSKLYPEESIPQQTNPFCNNANAAIRKARWRERRYNEDLSGLEDLEWAAWAISHGYGIAYNAEAAIIHVHNEEPHQVYNRYRREAMAMKRIYPEERFSVADLLRLFFSNVLADWRAASAQDVWRDVFGEVTWFRWMQFWGTYRGFREEGQLTSQLKRTFYYPDHHGSRMDLPGREVPEIDYGAILDTQDES